MKRLRATIPSFTICIILTFLGSGIVSAFFSHQESTNCPRLSEVVRIPDDGSWIMICYDDPSAPETALISETNFKIIFEHPNPHQMELSLSRTNSEIIKKISPESITKEGTGLFNNIHDFDGVSSQGQWIIRVRNGIPGEGGIVQNITIASLYSSGLNTVLPDSDHGGKLTTERLSPGAVKSTVIEEKAAKKEDEIFPKSQMSASYSVSIMSESFELNFPPSTGWAMYDANPNDGMEYFWDDDELRSYTGTWAAWPARGGVNGIDPFLSTTYPANTDAWMIYGPFDLSNAKSANIAFMLWRNIEPTYDHIFFGISGDGTTYGGWSWDGSADWENKSFSLGSYLGDSSVWIAWHFISDATIHHEGPWIDDILLEFEPGDIGVDGNFTYADRTNTMRGAVGTKVQLWDSDSGDDDLLAETIIIDSSGYFSFPALMNWDFDDTDPNLSNRRLDLFVVWLVENDNFRVTNGLEIPYYWESPTYNNIGMGYPTISYTIPFEHQDLPSMWIFQDIRRAREFYLNNTNPQSDPQFIAARWTENQNSEDFIPGSHFWVPLFPHIFIADDSIFSADTIVHEVGHHIMWNKTGQWLWYDFNCFDHEIFSQESIQCAWSEGWAVFFAIAVNGDACYDFGLGPCLGVIDINTYDLENHSRNDPPNNPINGLPWWGDGVEGRVAGSLYDLMDSENESPWYDNASWGFSTIVDIALSGSGKICFNEFWNGYQNNDKHSGIRSVYQNTIDYDQSPVFSAIPDHNTLQNSPHQHIIELWDYASDLESPDSSLSFQIVSVSDSRCGIGLELHWVNANPQLNWAGDCFVTVSVNDTLPNKTATTGFWFHVLEINVRLFLPTVMDQ